MSRVILCNLSLLGGEQIPFPSWNEDDEREKYRDEYSAPVGGETFWGYLTNEAPVCYLLHEAHVGAESTDEETDVDTICYLCTKECKGLDAYVLPDGTERELSTEAYFQESIKSYCRFTNITCPKFERIDHDPYDTKGSLRKVMEVVGSPGTVVDMDTTGGHRHSVNLMTLAIDVALAQSRGVASAADPDSKIRLGNIAYADFRGHGKKQKLLDQLETHGLVELVNAVDVFTRYGKAEALWDYFFGSDYLGHNCNDVVLQNLCESMRRFSDKLSLCDVGDIEQVVQEIHDGLDAYEKHFEVLWQDYELSCELSADVENEAEELIKKRAGDYRAEREACAGEDYAGEEDMSIECLRHIEDAANAEELKEAVKTFRGFVVERIGSGEILFNALIPSIRERFVAGRKRRGAGNCERALQILEIIHWCVDRQMLQQALALYCEKAPQCFVDLGLITWGEIQPDPIVALGNDAAINRIKQLLGADNGANFLDMERKEQIRKRLNEELGLNESQGTTVWKEWGPLLYMCYPQCFVNSEYAVVSVLGYRMLPLNIALYGYVCNVRNKVMHSGGEDERYATRSKSFLNNVIFSVDADLTKLEMYGEGDDEGGISHLSIESVTRLLKKAISVLESVTLNEKDPNRAQYEFRAVRCDTDNAAISEFGNIVFSAFSLNARFVELLDGDAPPVQDETPAFQLARLCLEASPRIEMSGHIFLIVNLESLPSKEKLQIGKNKSRLPTICRRYSERFSYVGDRDRLFACLRLR